MAHHKSAKKRIRQSEVRRLRNRYQYKTVRNAMRKFKALKDIKEAEEQFPKLASMIDKLSKRGVIHSNNAANKKAGLNKHLSLLSS